MARPQGEGYLCTFPKFRESLDRVRLSTGNACLLAKGLFWLLTVSVCVSSFVARAEDSGQSPHTTIDVGPSDLLVEKLADNWVSYNGDYTGRRFSHLTQITPENVSKLRPAWVFHSESGNILEVTPIVVNGVMFVTASNNAFALDSRTGRMLWHFSRPLSEGLIDSASNHRTRGIAIWGNKLYMETDNAHLLCLDSRSGALLWEVAYADDNKNYGATSVPLVVKGKVLVGTAGGDDGVRGFVAAYDAETGKQVWRFWTIPAPGEFGSSSWPGDTYLHGGATTWMPGTFDPQLNTLYWATGNPSPDFNGKNRPGDDLYTDCILALDPDTGKLKWYFQFTPHDLFDFDSTQTPVLVNTLYKGENRKLLVQANRNGFVYVLDRTNGKFLSATRFAQKMNWATGIDAKGRPIRTGVEPSASGTLICPQIYGATNWFSSSYSETTDLYYFLSQENCSIYFLKEMDFAVGRPYYSTGTKLQPGGRKVLQAFDPVTGTYAWKYPQVGSANSFGGVMSTATGLVFFGNDSQEFEAVDGKTGKSLWHFNTGQNLRASPMAYAVDGVQYMAIAAGSDLFTFSLPN